MPIDWEEDYMTELRRLLEEGLSSQKIANAMSHKFGKTFTRNSIIGRAHRIKAQFKTKTGKQTVQKKGKVIKVKTIVVSPPLQEVIELPVFLESRKTDITLMELNGDTCRWPSGDKAPYLFCGQTIDRGSYCKQHADLSYHRPNYYTGKTQ